jgi:hypothetical protein
MRRLAALLVGVAVSAATVHASAQTDAQREQARTFFESGLGHYDKAEWSAALADFLRSRELVPTRSATSNAAVCMRKEGRFEEAVELFEELLRTYTDLTPNERSFAEHQLAELRASVGSIELTNSEPAATIVIDGRARGTYPPVSGALRVSAGTRLVRVYKEGFVPLEQRVDVAGRQTVVVDAHLTPITAGGRLVVTEAQGRPLDVLVDDVVVGKTPWEATVAVGRHTVTLRGEGDLGTPPADATVARDQSTRLALAAEPLDSSLRVIPTPADALVSIDGVIVGNGVWEGRLRSGPHTIELAADGFLAQKRVAALAPSQRSSVDVTLERDVTSGAFRAAHPGRIYAELDLGGGIALAFGGDVRSSCTGGCSAHVPGALGGMLRGGYQFSSGILVGLDAGFLAIAAGTSDRSTAVTPRGLASETGTTDDAIYLRGFRIGPSLGWRTGDAFPFLTLRLGAGVFLGSGGDQRTGSFTDTSNAPYHVDLSESARAAYLYVAPEARIGTTIATRLEASVGLELLLLAALERPAWNDTQVVLAGKDGVGTFGKQSYAGTFLVLPVPTLGLRYAF